MEYWNGHLEHMVNWSYLLEYVVRLFRDTTSPALSPPALCAEWLAAAPLSPRSPAMKIIEEHKDQLKIKYGSLAKAD